jgi:tetratricopeptide (TPR) repeat protein
MTDFPPPPSSSPEALADYAAGLRLFREGQRDSACAAFERATKKDPQLAAAFLRLAMCAGLDNQSAARPAVRQTIALRSRLSERDQGLLDAMEPMYLRTVVDMQESARRHRALVARFPDDAEVVFATTGAECMLDFEAAIVGYARTLELDPDFAFARYLLADYLAYAGRFEEAQKTWTQCLELNGSSTSCLGSRAAYFREQGACDKMDADVRRWLTVEPNEALANALLAEALVSQGRSSQAARDVLKRRVEKCDPADRAVKEQQER